MGGASEVFVADQAKPGLAKQGGGDTGAEGQALPAMNPMDAAGRTAFLEDRLVTAGQSGDAQGFLGAAHESRVHRFPLLIDQLPLSQPQGFAVPRMKSSRRAGGGETAQLLGTDRNRQQIPDTEVLDYPGAGFALAVIAGGETEQAGADQNRSRRGLRIRWKMGIVLRR